VAVGCLPRRDAGRRIQDAELSSVLANSIEKQLHSIGHLVCLSINPGGQQLLPRLAGCLERRILAISEPEAAHCPDLSNPWEHL